MPKVALAYSGHLDTDICIWYLKNVLGMKVITFSADVGQPEYLEPLAERAVQIGAFAAHLADLRERFVQEYIFPVIKADAVYQGHYHLFSALARPLIMTELVGIARDEGATMIAHGSHGAGNDAIRFERIAGEIAPDLKILTPLRDLGLASPADEVAYAREHGIPTPSIEGTLRNVEQNLWGVNIQLHQTDAWDDPPSDARLITTAPEEAPATPAVIELEFAEGVPVALDGEKLPPVELIERLTKIGGRAGVGWYDVMEDRVRPRKMREVYEAPAATIVHAAHRALEALLLEREPRQFIERMASRYAQIVYDGRWFSPLRRSLEKFYEELNRPIAGTVRLKLYRGRLDVVGARSPNSKVGPP